MPVTKYFSKHFNKVTTDSAFQKTIISFVVFFLIFTTINIHAQTVVPIASIRNNDSNGVCIDTGKTFTVAGIVTSSNQMGTSGPGTIQDATGGVAVYGSNFAGKVKIGDSVSVTAVLTNYSGLAELSNLSSSSVSILSSNHSVEPEVITINDIINQQWNGFESYESKLIRINNVTISSSGNFSGNKNYDISDDTGTLAAGLRIDIDVTSIVGNAIPSGKVDIIGVLGQYKTKAPFNSGYQLMPRFIDDIVTNGEPLILSPVFASGITTTSFTVYFNTVRNGNTIIKYGLTSSLETDSIVVNDDTTYHKINLTGLKPSTVYYYKVYSLNANGVSQSDVQQVSTASDNPSVGTINIYFNYPVDTTLAYPGNAARGSVLFNTKLVNRINQAVYSIDMAVYSFYQRPDVVNALIAAKARGVKIRVVYDSRTTQPDMQSLIDDGILISKRPASLNGIMHNKFFIFDARDTVQANDWLWTGSWNVTNTEASWQNNVVEINDPTITKAYQAEFEEMWGSTTDTPNVSAAKFGPQKSDNTSHSFNIGGKSVMVYFSPSDGTNSHIIDALNSANHDIYLAQLVITRDDIGTAMYNRYNAGVKDIRGVVNDINVTGSEYQYLSTFADMHQNTISTLHDKYGIVDALTASSDPVVITGSHNWSSAAENDNDENTLIIHDSLIANQYIQDFKKRYNDAGGTGVFQIATGINDRGANNFSYVLCQNYPNPFNPVTAISYQLPAFSHVTIKLYDLLGREVATLVDENRNAGRYSVQLSADNYHLSSGVYFYQLKSGGYIQTKKMILMK